MSGMFPNIHNEYEAAAVIEYGRALGIHHIFALQTISPVKGKLCVESKVLYALALDKGIKIKIVKKDAKGCTLEFSSPGRDAIATTFTEEDAKRAGLMNKPGFMMYPEEMHFNRCISKGLRAFDPRVFLGLSTREEAEGFEESPLAQRAPAEKPTKAEEKKKDQVSFTKTKDQPAGEPEKEEKPPEPPAEEDSELKEKEKVVESIKACLKKANVDEKLFKKWLGEELQIIRSDRKFVDLKFGNWSFTEGNIADLKILSENMEWAIVKGYLESKTFKAEAQKKEPDEAEEEIPF